MQLKQLVYFTTIIEAQSFSAAAKKLYIAQPTLSQSIQSLEAELGFQLLTRSNNGVVPTDMGKTVFQDAKRILEETEQVKAKWLNMDRIRKSISGVIRLVVYPSAYAFVSRQIVARFRDTYPNLHWNLLESRGGSLPSVFEKQQVSFGIGDYVTADEASFQQFLEPYGLKALPLCNDICKIAVSQKNPLAQKRDLSLKDTEKLSLAYYSGGDDVADPHFTRFFNDKLAIELHSFDKIAEAAINDVAVCPLAQGITQKGLLSEYRKNTVSFLTVEGFFLPVTHCLIYDPNAEQTPETECARELIMKAFRELNE